MIFLHVDKRCYFEMTSQNKQKWWVHSNSIERIGFQSLIIPVLNQSLQNIEAIINICGIFNEQDCENDDTVEKHWRFYSC